MNSVIYESAQSAVFGVRRAKFSKRHVSIELEKAFLGGFGNFFSGQIFGVNPDG